MALYDIISGYQGGIFSLSLSPYPSFSSDDTKLNFSYIQNLETVKGCITYLSKFEIVPDLYFRFFSGSKLFRYHLNVAQVKRLTACTFCPMVADIDIQSESKIVVVLKTVYTCCKTSQQDCVQHNTYTFTFENINTSRLSDQQDVFFPYWTDPFQNGCVPDGLTKATLTLQLSDNFTIQRRQTIEDFRDTCPDALYSCPDIPIAPDTGTSYFATPGFILVNLSSSDSSLSYFYFLNDFTLFDPLSERQKTAVSIQRQSSKSVIGGRTFCITCQDIDTAINKQRTSNTIGIIGLSNPEGGRTDTDKFKIPNINILYGMYPNKGKSPQIFNAVRNRDIIRIVSKYIPQVGDIQQPERFLSYRAFKSLEPTPTLSCADENSCDDPYIYWQILKTGNEFDTNPLHYGDTFYLQSMSQYKAAQPAYACLFLSSQEDKQGNSPFLKGISGECETWFFVNPAGGSDVVLYDTDLWIKSLTSPSICANGGKYMYRFDEFGGSVVRLEPPSKNFNDNNNATWQVLKLNIVNSGLLCSSPSPIIINLHPVNQCNAVGQPDENVSCPIVASSDNLYNIWATNSAPDSYIIQNDQLFVLGYDTSDCQCIPAYNSPSSTEKSVFLKISGSYCGASQNGMFTIQAPENGLFPGQYVSSNSCGTNNTPCMQASTYSWMLDTLSLSTTETTTVTFQAPTGTSFGGNYMSTFCFGAQRPCMYDIATEWNIQPISNNRYYIREKSTGLYLTTSVPRGFTAPGLKDISPPGIDEEWIITQSGLYTFYKATPDASQAIPFFFYSLPNNNFIDFSALQSQPFVKDLSSSPNSYYLWDSKNDQWLTNVNYLPGSQVIGTSQQSDATLWNFSPITPPVVSTTTIDIVINDISIQQQDNAFTYAIGDKANILTLLQPQASGPLSVNITFKAYETTGTTTIIVLLSPNFNYSNNNYFVFTLTGQVRLTNSSLPTAQFVSSNSVFSFYDSGIVAVYQQDRKAWVFSYTPPILYPSVQ